MSNIQVVDLLNELEIYSDPRDGGQLLSKAPTVGTLRWTRRFSQAGSFQLITAFSQENFELYRPYDPEVSQRGHILYKRDNNEAAFIEGRKVIMTLDG